MKLMKCVVKAVAAAALAGLTATAANANIYESMLEYTAVDVWQSTGGVGMNTSNTPPYFGKVTLTEGVSANGAYVDVHVDLYNNFRFVDTGSAQNHAPFAFNLTNPGLASLVLNTPWVANNPLATSSSPFGTFNMAVDCCATGAANAQNPPLDFRVNSTNGITFFGAGGYWNNANDYSIGEGDRFSSNSDGSYATQGPGGWWFTADVVDMNGNTGLVAARDLVFTAVPEPETYAMLLAGLGLMGFVARRRSKQMAA